MRLVMTAVLGTALMGCGDEGTDTSSVTTTLPACNGLAAEIGEGEFGYEVRNPGDGFTMVHGPQGGWHMDIAGVVTGSNGVVRVQSFVTADSTSTQIAGAGQENDTPLQLAGYDESICSGSFFKGRTFIDDVDLPSAEYQGFICNLHNQPLTIEVHITDLKSEETAITTLSATAQIDPNDVPECQAL